jgi:hypothetical protein
VDGGRLLPWSKRWQPAKKGIKAAARARKQGGDSLARALDIAAQRKDEGTGPPRSGIAPREQGVERGQRLGLAAGNCEAERQSAPGLGLVDPRQNRAIIALRLPLATEQVKREPAVECDQALGGAQRPGLLEQSQRRLRLPHVRQSRALPGLGSPMRGVDLLSAAEEADRRLRIAKPKRGTAGRQLRVIVARVDRDQPNVARQRRFGRLQRAGERRRRRLGGTPTDILCCRRLRQQHGCQPQGLVCHPHPVAGSS